MKPANTVSEFRPSWGERTARLAGQCFVIALGWYAMDSLLHLRLRVADFLALYGAWAGCLMAAEAGRARWSGPGWLWTAVAVGVPGVFAAWINPGLRYPLSMGILFYSVILMAVLRALWSSWRVAEPERHWSETCRRVLILVAALWVVFPLFTDRLVGGRDARWYSYMLADFIEQARAGVFPVFVGQGEFAYNGSVHLFRSAPLYMWLAGLWDWATFKSLSVVALQHLSGITASVGAAFALYVGLAALVPQRRWLACFCAAIYALSPGILAPLYLADMYMTFVAGAALPLVAVGNLRVWLRDDSTGWRLLAAGLALTWMAHPPTGLLACLVTLAVQVLSWAGAEDGSLWRTVRRTAPGLLWFAGLSAYYFATMSQLPPRPGARLLPDLIAVCAAGAWCFAVVRVLWLREWKWTWLFAAAAVGLLVTHKVWGIWAGVFLVVAAIRAGLGRTRSPELVRRWAGFEVVLLGLIALGLSWPIAQHLGFPTDVGTLAGLDAYGKLAYKGLLPVDAKLDGIWSFQPGWAVVALLLAGLAGVLVRQRAGALAAVLSGMALVVGLMLFRIPGVSPFIVGYVPLGIGHICSIPLPHRLFPIAIAMAAAGGFLTLATLGERGRRVGVIAVAVLALWSGFEARRFVQRGLGSTLSRPLTERAFLPENVVLDRYAYDLLPIPAYYSNSETEPRLEVRLLGPDHKVKVGPDEIARLMEGAWQRTFDLTQHPHPTAPNWLRLQPGTHVNPKELLLLRFAFDPTETYTGYLIGNSPFGDYREYALPQTGLPKAFGTTEGASRVLALRNSGIYAIEYTWDHFQKPGSTLVGDGSRYATVVASRYDEERSPIQVKSFIPFTVRVRTSEPGFLESPRVFLPGYAATVDDKEADVLESPERLVMVAVPAGEHTIEIRYVGTARVWIAGVISVLTWAALLWRWRRTAEAV